MSQMTEEEKRAIIKRELYSTESETSSSDVEPNTNIPSPFFPSSISPSTSSSHVSEESPEIANKVDSSSSFITASGECLQPSTPDSHTEVSKIVKRRESSDNVSLLSDSTSQSSAITSVDEAELYRNEHLRIGTSTALYLSSSSSELNESRYADDSNIVSKTENDFTTDYSSNASSEFSERSAVVPLKDDASTASQTSVEQEKGLALSAVPDCTTEDEENFECSNKHLPGISSEENSDISQDNIPEFLGGKEIGQDVHKTTVTSRNVKESKEGSTHENMAASECKKDVDFSKYYPIFKSPGTSISHSPSEEKISASKGVITTTLFCGEIGQFELPEKPRDKSREVSASETRLFKDCAYGKEKHILAECRKKSESVSPDKEFCTKITKNASEHTSQARTRDQSKLKNAMRPKRSTRKTASASKKCQSQKSASSTPPKLSRSEDTTGNFRSRRQNLNQGETLPPEYRKSMSGEEFDRSLEIIAARFRNDRMRVEKSTGLKKIFARMIISETKADVLKYAAILRCTAHLESYVISMDRRTRQYARARRILLELLGIANELYSHTNSRHLILIESFYRALQVEQNYEEDRQSRNETRERGLILDTFQETVGTQYIPEITEQDFEPFNIALGVGSDINTSRASTDQNSVPSSSTQSTPADEDIITGIIRTCMAPLRSLIRNSESCSEKSQGRSTSRRYSDTFVNEANPYISDINTTTQSSSGSEKMSTTQKQIVRNKSPKDLGVKKTSSKGSQNSERTCDYNLRNRSKSADSYVHESSEVEVGERTSRHVFNELEKRPGSGQKCLSGNISKSEFNISTSNRCRVPTVKRVLPSKIGSVDTDRSARKRGYVHHSESGSNEDREEITAKKYVPDYSSITTHSSEVSRDNTVGKRSIRNLRSYSNDSHRSGSMADISESATESRESTESILESSECMGDSTEPVEKSPVPALDIAVSSFQSDVSDVAKCSASSKVSSDSDDILPEE